MYGMVKVVTLVCMTHHETVKSVKAVSRAATAHSTATSRTALSGSPSPSLGGALEGAGPGLLLPSVCAEGMASCAVSLHTYTH